jgi:hypothetical protein
MELNAAKTGSQALPQGLNAIHMSTDFLQLIQRSVSHRHILLFGLGVFGELCIGPVRVILGSFAMSSCFLGNS